MEQSDSHRRTLLKAASAAFTTALFTGQVKGANDRVAAAFIGMGRMGNSNMSAAMRQPGLAVTAVCDVYQPHLERAAALTRSSSARSCAIRRSTRFAFRPRITGTPDGRRGLQGRQGRVCRETCLHLCGGGAKMVAAARKYKRVVQGGTMQRSGKHFIEGLRHRAQRRLGEITVCRTWNYSMRRPKASATRPTARRPAGTRLGYLARPRSQAALQQNRFGVDPKRVLHFRWFWDYAGGMMTDWGVHCSTSPDGHGRADAEVRGCPRRQVPDQGQSRNPGYADGGL
jgi:hypothetical protein